jgi:hypothetical protein
MAKKHPLSFVRQFVHLLARKGPASFFTNIIKKFDNCPAVSWIHKQILHLSRIVRWSGASVKIRLHGACEIKVKTAYSRRKLGVGPFPELF